MFLALATLCQIWIAKSWQVDGEPAGISVPDSVNKMWHGHPVHGSEYAAWFDTFMEESPKPEKSKKRPHVGSGAPPPPRKIGKVDTATPPDMKDLASLMVKDGEEPTNTVLQRVSLLNLQNIDLVIQAGSVFLKNVGEQKVWFFLQSFLLGDLSEIHLMFLYHPQSSNDS